jgi:two-component system chemotaxis response regulator CheB
VPYNGEPVAMQQAAFDVVVMTASQGGRAVLERILAVIPCDFPAPIIVSTHMYEHTASLLPSLLSKHAKCPVKSIENGEVLLPGIVYVAVPGRHAIVSGGQLLLSDTPRVNFTRPSADVLLQSASDAFGARTLGIILTGNLDDGARGAEAVMQAGGVMLAQELASCEAPSMPRAAMQRNAIHMALRPEAIAIAIMALVPLPGIRRIMGFSQAA